MFLSRPPNVEKMNASRDVNGLINALGYQKEVNVRRTAAEALGKLGDVRAVEPLLTARKDTNDGVRKAATQALALIGLEPLIVALKDSDGDVRKAASEALAEIGDARASEPLIALAIDDYDYDVQVAAMQALAKIGDSRALEPLIKYYGGRGLWKEEREFKVGAATVATIKKLDPTWSEPVEAPHFVILFRDGTRPPSNPEKYYRAIVQRAYGRSKVEIRGWRIAGLRNPSVDEARYAYEQAIAWAGALPNWGIPARTWAGKGPDGASVVALFFA